MKLIVFFLGLTIIGCSTVKNNKNENTHVAPSANNKTCDTIILRNDNVHNDTSKVILLRTAIFDTTACLIHGFVVDQKTGSPLKTAEVSLSNLNINYQRTTDDLGEFKIFNDEICSGPEWYLNISYKDYVCELIKLKPFAGGQWIKIKLKKN